MFSETTTNLSDFNILEEIGKGSFGYVYKVIRIKDGEIYALKKVIMNKLKTKEKENTLNEVRILASLNNLNVISYKEAFYDNPSNSVCIVMEFAENGDLEKKISQCIKNKTFLTESEIISYLIQILRGLKILHDKKIMHRDIKAANIFLFKDNIVKIGDLNVSKVVKRELIHTQTGTPYYASPEVWSDKPYDYKSDIWSLGCLLYEMTTLKAPFRGTTMKGVYEKVIKGVYDPIPNIYSRSLYNIINQMLQIRPQNRPTCDQLINTLEDKMKNLKMSIDMIKLKTPSINLSQESNSNRQNSYTIKLLKTIKFPKRLLDLNTVLPKSKYQKRINSAFIGNNENLEALNENKMEELKLPLNRPMSSIERNKLELKNLNPVNRDRSVRNIFSDIYNRNNNKLIDNLFTDINYVEHEVIPSLKNIIKTEQSEDPVLRLINKPILLKRNIFNKINNESRDTSIPLRIDNKKVRSLIPLPKKVLNHNYHYNNTDFTTNLTETDDKSIINHLKTEEVVRERKNDSFIVRNKNIQKLSPFNNNYIKIESNQKERSISAIIKHDRNNSSNIKRIFNQDSSQSPQKEDHIKIINTEINKNDEKSIILQDVSYLPTLENKTNNKIFNILNLKNNNSKAIKITKTPHMENLGNKILNIKNMNLYPIKQEKEKHNSDLKNYNEIDYSRFRIVYPKIPKILSHDNSSQKEINI